MPERSKHQIGDGPIQEDLREMMNDLARALDMALNGDDRPKRIGFVLLTFPFGATDGRCNYISNGASPMTTWRGRSGRTRATGARRWRRSIATTGGRSVGDKQENPDPLRSLSQIELAGTEINARRFALRDEINGLNHKPRNQNYRRGAAHV